LVLYITARTADDPGFGDTHLNKALYWADFNAYRELGHLIAGARYFKLQHGPAAKPLLPLRDELAEAGHLEIHEPPPGSRAPRKTIPLRPPDTALFDAAELALVDVAIARLCGRTATAISAEAHEQSVGWQLVELYEDIPYRSALVSDELAGETTLAAGLAALRRLDA
jgi:hypothetical protein